MLCTILFPIAICVGLYKAFTEMFLDLAADQFRELWNITYDGFTYFWSWFSYSFFSIFILFLLKVNELKKNFLFHLSSYFLMLIKKNRVIQITNFFNEFSLSFLKTSNFWGWDWFRWYSDRFLNYKKFTKYWTTCPGIYFNSYFVKRSAFPW